MQKTPYNIDIIVFLVVVSALIIAMVAFIIGILYLYRKRQQQFEKDLEQQKLDYEKSILNTQLEIQEQTFQHISREIHDNISLSLTLAKLNLNTIDWLDTEKSGIKVANSIELLSQSIAQLSDISKSLDADIIIRQGLLKVIEEELGRIQKTGLEINYTVTGNPVYMDTQEELIIFRIIQEAFNNIIKHARTRTAALTLYYNNASLGITIADEGTGFDPSILLSRNKAGLKNMENRTKTLNGRMAVNSRPGRGTTLNFIIPFQNKDEKH